MDGVVVTRHTSETNKSIKKCEDLAMELAKEVMDEERRVKDCKEKMKESIESQVGLSNSKEISEPEKTTSFFSYHFTFPYYKVALSDDK